MKRLPPLYLVVVALVAASPAGAALSFTFDRAIARPGTIVFASEPGWSGAAEGVTIYLVPTRLPGVTPDRSPGTVLRVTR